jgi:mannose-6-phosphate isomerase
VLRIGPAIQHYAWGDREYLPALLGRPATGEPVAECWYGAHRQAPSPLLDGPGTLADALGAELPFLLKLLAAAVPLSLQVHPSAQQAAAGFAREEAVGIPASAPHRSYRDPNPKPELIVALTPFVAACGFRPLAATNELLGAAGHPDLAPLREVLSTGGPATHVLRDALSWLLACPAEAAAVLAGAAVSAMAGVPAGSPWELERQWCPRVHQAFPGDIGVVVALLLNHVALAPGQGLFLDAGNLHAYLGGAGVEVMANSDNVLRAGLTPKHVDRGEVLAVVDTTPLEPAVQTAGAGHHRFRAPTPWFSLERDELTGDQVPVGGDGAELVLISQGAVTTPAGPIRAGEAVVITAGEQTATLSGTGVCWRAKAGGISV